ncbi:MAG TPA: hypothetical protein VGH49_02660, partial [Xanthobacteraceae bacterium]
SRNADRDFLFMGIGLKIRRGGGSMAAHKKKVAISISADRDLSGRPSTGGWGEWRPVTTSTSHPRPGSGGCKKIRTFIRPDRNFWTTVLRHTVSHAPVI